MNPASALLLSAAERNDPSDALAQIEQGADIDAQDRDGYTALIWAVRHNNPSFVSALLALAPDLSLSNAQGNTPLLIALQKGNVALIRQLAAYGANVNALDRHSRTPLDYAVHNSSAEMIRALQSLSAQTTRPLIELLGFTPQTLEERDDRGWTPLARAVRDADAKRVRLLLDAGADIEHGDLYGTTPLMIASRASRDGILELLLARGANLEARDLAGKTALHYAVEGWNVAHVEMLIALKANLFAFDNNNLTPRLLAQKQSMTDIAEILHRAEPTGYAKSESVAWSLLGDAEAVEGFDLHTAAWANDMEIVSRLLEEGVSVEVRIGEGVTPLMTASGAGNLEIVKRLVKRGASLEACDGKGNIAQDWARKNDQIEVLRWLQEAAGIDWRKLEKSTERPFDW